MFSKNAGASADATQTVVTCASTDKATPWRSPPLPGICVQGRVGAPYSHTAPVKVTSAIHALCVCLCSLLHLSLLSLPSSHALLSPLVSHL